jgi:DNA-binding PadR family transcriptional regulator
MSQDRDLTTLEFIVLGLISMQPQSGYSIVSYFDTGASSWSASPGSIYPMLKRLEKNGVVDGELEMAHETRPRKIYTLTELGEQLLDKWLLEVPGLRPFYQERELAMWRFQFMEQRFSKPIVVEWLNQYLDGVRYADAVTEAYSEGVKAALEESGEYSLHRQLAMEAYIMEVNTIRSWIEMAKARLTIIAHQTGEYRAVQSTEDEQ